ncbi:dual-specificity RNA methyltransferase RlmN [Striga asiatica]|uniref:Dual-specificity RNA methyltransferase RlmN n=1 Tax=Striga asiatica TaxID=4170 RepID=A0A5A7PA48_STRAF|nr:dual-specificity RNA methyltransferase RlmN [Striga asiatica]
MKSGFRIARARNPIICCCRRSVLCSRSSIWCRYARVICCCCRSLTSSVSKTCLSRLRVSASASDPNRPSSTHGTVGWRWDGGGGGDAGEAGAGAGGKLLLAFEEGLVCEFPFVRVDFSEALQNAFLVRASVGIFDHCVSSRRTFEKEGERLCVKGLTVQIQRVRGILSDENWKRGLLNFLSGWKIEVQEKQRSVEFLQFFAVGECEQSGKVGIQTVLYRGKLLLLFPLGYGFEDYDLNTPMQIISVSSPPGLNLLCSSQSLRLPASTCYAPPSRSASLSAEAKYPRAPSHSAADECLGDE